MTESRSLDGLPWSDRWKRFAALTAEQRLDLAVALLRRDPLARRDSSFEFVRKHYPEAAEDLIHAIVHHLYWELPDDLCNLLSYIELCIQDGEHHAHNGLIHSVLYNLYNLSQAEALIPDARKEVFDWLTDVKECVEVDDREGALATLKALMEKFESSESPPDFD